jgi:hypothetical protein
LKLSWISMSAQKSAWPPGQLFNRRQPPAPVNQEGDHAGEQFEGRFHGMVD